jgi:hypothetical protein
MGRHQIVMLPSRAIPFFHPVNPVHPVKIKRFNYMATAEDSREKAHKEQRGSRNQRKALRRRQGELTEE